MLFLFSIKKRDVEYNGVKFRPLTISREHCQMFESYLHSLSLLEDGVMYDQSYWVVIEHMTRSKVMSVLYKELNGCLCLFALNNAQSNIKLLVDPIGTADKKADALAESLELLAVCNASYDKNFSIVRECNADYAGIIPVDYRIEKLTSKDMLYSVPACIEMNGSAYKTHRRKIHKLERSCDLLEVFEYDKSVMKNDVIHLYSEWMDSRRTAYDRFEDIGTVPLFLDDPDSFGLRLLVLYQRDIPIAYSTVGKLCSDAMMMNQRKALLSYDGACEYMWWYGLKDYYENVEPLPYENDGGFEYKGLYTFKSRYNPIKEVNYIGVIKH